MISSRRLSLVACGLLLLLPLVTLAQGGKLTFRSQDGELQLTLSEGWEKIDLHTPESQIQAANKARHEFVSVTDMASADYVGKLDEFAHSHVKPMQDTLFNAVLSEPRNFQVNGMNWVQYEVHGVLPKAKLKMAYVLTFVQTQKHLVQFTAWTLESHFAADAEEMRGLAKGISETAPAGH